MRSWFLILLATAFAQISLAQSNFVGFVKDSLTKQPLASVTVKIKDKNIVGITDTAGFVLLKNIPPGNHTILFSSAGYQDRNNNLNFPLEGVDSIIILMLPAEKEIEEVVISSARTESRIENTPTRVEVLGSEEVNEEAGIKPGNIASLLGDIAGIQTQQTSAATGNTEMRVQGLPGNYTQLLRDGMPLFGGYAGNFSVLQIPPLDLKQIEIVKGSVSTLYGGGAIAGMINLISKKPREGKFEKTILLNQSSLGESNVHAFLADRKNKFGYTFFTGLTHQKQKDVNEDGFSDIPGIESYFLHPAFFVYPNKKSAISVGYNGVFEKRKGGDMQVLKNRPDSQHQYFDKNQLSRHTINLNYDFNIPGNNKLSFKSTASWFSRKILTNVFGTQGQQLSYYNEFSYLKRTKKNVWVGGINFNGEKFSITRFPDSLGIDAYNFFTAGFFLQDDWRMNEKVTVETGLRLDHHNQYGNFFLPRFSLLYKINAAFITRFGGGLGYAIPSAFESDIDERDYKFLRLFENIKAEKSAGANWDVNFHHKISEWNITVNQTFYYTRISQPVVKYELNPYIYFSNATRPIDTKGLETYVQLQHDELEIYLGYVYTIAKKLYDAAHPYMSLSARNKFASVLAYEFSKNFRAGIEAAFTGRQYLDDGRKTPAFLFVAAMMRYDYKMFSFVLNGENLFDYRQTKKENIVFPPYNNPSFKQLWAPIDGRVINFSVRVKMD
ncbi:MAG: TonB-dependent receptor [Chitinophagaceae bacterium]